MVTVLQCWIVCICNEYGVNKYVPRLCHSFKVYNCLHAVAEPAAARHKRRQHRRQRERGVRVPGRGGRRGGAAAGRGHQAYERLGAPQVLQNCGP